MTEPELKNGYTRVAHELLEQIAKAPFTAAEYKILLTVIRQTYGYHKKSAALSMKYLSKHCNLHFTSVSRAMKKLLDKQVVTEVSSPAFSRARQVSINKNYSEWKVSEPTPSTAATPSTDADERVSAKANERVSTEADDIKNNYKNNFKDIGGKKPPTLELIINYCIGENISLDVGKKFFDHYERRGWVTNRGTDISGFWRDKLREWAENENPQFAKDKKAEASYAAYDRELVKRLLEKDD